MNYRYCPLCGSALEEREIDAVVRRCCPRSSCGFIHWNNPVPVVAGLIILNGEVLLVHQRGWPAKMLSVVTGFLEAGESPEMGIAREVAEELGLKTLSTGWIGAYPFAPQNQVILAFEVHCEGEPRTSEEIDRFKAVSIDRLQGWDFGPGLAIRDWLSRRRERS